MRSIRPVSAQVPDLLLAVTLFVAGCSSMGNTLAQDLAWQRWEKCKHFPTIKLKEIKTDGQIWVWTQYGPDLSAWKECERKAGEEQARGVAVSPPPSSAIAAVQPATSLPPVWRRGDEWAFRWESPTGKGTFVWSVDREEAIDGVPHYVIKGGTREIFYRKVDFAYTRETVDGASVLIYTPPRLRYVWPLEVGKTWEQTVREERPGARQTEERVDAVTVEAEETITVLAGTFKTFKIVCRKKGTGAIRYEEWYSPELKHPVLFRENLASGLRVRELIAFKLR